MNELSREQINVLVDAVAARLSGAAHATRPASSRAHQAEHSSSSLQARERGSSQMLQPRTGTGSARPSADTYSAASAAVPVARRAEAHAAPARSSVAYATLDEAVAAAKTAQPKWIALPMELRKVIIADIRRALRLRVEELSRLAVEETGLGRYEDKLSKNRLVIDKTPGPEYLESVAFTGDDGLALIEYAPYGIIGSITPTTNPSETVINNGISIISAGNGVVFNPHPSAKKVSLMAIQAINDVIVAHGGPHGLLTTIAEPTIDTAQALMKHPGVRLLVVTGGPAVVKTAMASGKKVIAAGPGNPPVVVDETADLDQAADGIVKGASLDNNIVCIAEKEIIAVASIADELIRKLKQHGGYLLSPYQVKQLEGLILDKESGGKYPNKKFVGKDAGWILAQIGGEADRGTRILFCEVEESHPFVQVELLMPVIPLVRVKDVSDAIETAKRVEHGNGHTAVMYSKNIDNLHRMAKEINTSIFIKNAPSYAGLGLGGEGYTSFTIASPTGEGLTTCRTFSRIRRCTLKDHFRIV